MTTRWLHQQFADCAAALPQATAVICDDQRLSYAELDSAANRTAAGLAALGVSKGDIVALFFPPSTEQIVCMLAVLRCGAAWVSLDAAWPAQRRSDVLTRVSPRLVLTNDSTEDQCAWLPPEITAHRYSELPSGRKDSPPQAELAADDLCYLMFTSGSTGQPNGVRVSHGNVSGLISNLRNELHISSNDCWSALHSAAFGFSLWEIWGALSTGGSLLIIPQAQRGDPWSWDALARENRVSVLSLTPSGLRQWLAAEGGPLPEHLRLVVLSGEPLAREDVERWFARGSEAPAKQRPRLVNTYALTETAGRVAMTDVAADQPASLLGRPTSDAELRLVDPKSRQTVATGDVGELCIAGPMISLGYLDNEALTAERFIWMDPGDGRERLFYRSGDLARLLPDGNFEFVGREDEQIKLRGHRIEPADIEAALQAHPDVSMAAVVAVGDQNNPRLHAYVTPQADQAAKRLEFWPSLGEYQIYDELLYDFMSADEVRVASYRRAFERDAEDKVVLDIGTGKDALLARLAAQCGARHVYAVEVLPDVAASATALIEKLGLQDRITVICGDMETVELPETIDLCTQGIVGNIGSSDGIAPIWNSARRFFSASAVAVPSRCTTFIAPASLPDDVRAAPAFDPLAADYARRIFEAEGASFDVRLCVRNFPMQALLADAAVFEQLDFGNELSADYNDEARFLIQSSGWLDGYVLWTRIDVDDHNSVDFLEHQQAWLPVWFPVGDEPVYVQQGAVVHVRWSSATPAGQVFPDYRIESRLGPDSSYVYSSAHHSEGCGNTALHRSLLASLESASGAIQEPAVGLPDEAELQAWLGKQLPEYMLPAAISLVSELPLNSSRKLDRRQLRDRAAQLNDSRVIPLSGTAVTDEFELQIGALWSDVLGVDIVARELDFFDAGGDSISAVRLTTDVQRLLDDAVFLAGLFEASTLGAYCDWLRENHAPAVAKRLSQPRESTGAGSPVTTSADLIPASWAQQSLWFLQQLYPDNTAANEQFLIRLSHICPERLAEAWGELVHRHDVLSTRFVTEEPTDLLAGSAGPVLQQLADADSVARIAALSDVLDFSASADPESDLHRLAATEILVRFDLSVGHLLRPVLVKLCGSEWVLLVTAHHIVADGLCVPLIRNELFSLYQNDSLPLPSARFADFAHAQRDLVKGEWLDAEIDWWRKQLANAIVEPVLCTRPHVSSAGPETRIPFALDSQSSRALREFADQQGASLFVTLLAVWRAWLARCFMRDDFLIGSPVTQRTTAETSEMLGCLVNNVAFRNGLDMQQGFVATLQAEREQVLASLDHSALPFEKIVEELQPERVYGRHPLFQFMFQFEQRAAPLVGEGGEHFAVDVLPVDRASYWDIELSVCDVGEHEPLQCFIGVRTDLFEANALSGWTDGLQTFITALLADPHRHLAELPLLSAEQQAARKEFNRTSMPVPDASLYDLFARQAGVTPNAVAVANGADSICYAELLQRAEKCASALQALGIRRDDTVGVHMRRGPEAVVLFLAINACGAAWLALDPEYPANRLQHMLALAEPMLVVCEEANIISEHAGSNGYRVCTLQSLHKQKPSAEFARTEPAEQLCVLFTSGSTGMPKGVALSQRSALSRCLWMWQRFDFGGGRIKPLVVKENATSSQEVFGHRTSLNFVDAIWEIFGALLHGGRVDIAPREAQQDMSAQARWVVERGITHAVTFPSALNLLMDVWREAPPEQMHTLIITGESWAPALLHDLQQALPRCRLINTYGTTENWDITAAELQSRHELDVIPAGRPVANTRVHVVDRFRQALPAGVVGQLCVGGYGVGQGYLQRPELTAERYFLDLNNVRDKEGTNDSCGKLFLTGDLASINSVNEIELHGRADRQLKLRGVRIEPGEIEALVNRLPEIRQSAVVVHGAEHQSSWLALYIVVADVAAGPSILIERLRDLLRENLPAAAVPADITIVDCIPLTPSGKIDAAELERTAPRKQHTDAQQFNATEQALTAIWEQALSVDGIGRHDDFFAVRGNSLLATRVMARVCDAFDLDLPLACIFESPTVAELARTIDAMLWATQGREGSSDGRVDDGDLEGDDNEREVVQL